MVNLVLSHLYGRCPLIIGRQRVDTRCNFSETLEGVSPDMRHDESLQPASPSHCSRCLHCSSLDQSESSVLFVSKIVMLGLGPCLVSGHRIDKDPTTLYNQYHPIHLLLDLCNPFQTLVLCTVYGAFASLV